MCGEFTGGRRFVDGRHVGEIRQAHTHGRRRFPERRQTVDERMVVRKLWGRDLAGTALDVRGGSARPWRFLAAALGVRVARFPRGGDDPPRPVEEKPREIEHEAHGGHDREIARELPARSLHASLHRGPDRERRGRRGVVRGVPALVRGRGGRGGTGEGRRGGRSGTGEGRRGGRGGGGRIRRYSRPVRRLVRREGRGGGGSLGRPGGGRAGEGRRGGRGGGGRIRRYSRPVRRLVRREGRGGGGSLGRPGGGRVGRRQVQCHETVPPRPRRRPPPAEPLVVPVPPVLPVERRHGRDEAVQQRPVVRRAVHRPGGLRRDAVRVRVRPRRHVHDEGEGQVGDPRPGRHVEHQDGSVDGEVFTFFQHGRDGLHDGVGDAGAPRRSRVDAAGGHGRTQVQAEAEVESFSRGGDVGGGRVEGEEGQQKKRGQERRRQSVPGTARIEADRGAPRSIFIASRRRRRSPSYSPCTRRHSVRQLRAQFFVECSVGSRVFFTAPLPGCRNSDGRETAWRRSPRGTTAAKGSENGRARFRTDRTGMWWR
mmetsp:Transcript_24555/g.48883  ORF Transcript_24555/g.48883 Transcript_24555/m.48883 type:complete len:539 (-) Transcript_24555:57-1673(-)